VARRRTEPDKHDTDFRRKLSRIPKRDVMTMVDGHVGEVSRAVLAMQTGPEPQFAHALWEATRLSRELTIMLEELSPFET